MNGNRGREKVAVRYLCAGMRGTEGCEAVRVIRGTPELKVVEL